MQISYGPRGQSGVTSLMAVGADELEENATDRIVRLGGWGALGAWALGEVSGNRALANIGLGGVIALWGVRFWTRCSQQVQVTQPAPQAGYFSR